MAYRTSPSAQAGTRRDDARHRISRRDALRLTLAVGAATAAPTPGHAAPPAWQEAPGLAQASKQGTLPDVGQRLPAHP